MDSRCQFIKEDGKRCKARPITGDVYCYFHSSKVSQEDRREASSRGGKSKSIVKPLPPVKISKISDIASLLADTINRTRAGEMPARVANAVGGLSNYLLKAIEMSELEDRIKKLEEQIKKEKGRGESK